MPKQNNNNNSGQSLTPKVWILADLIAVSVVCFTDYIICN